MRTYQCVLCRRHKPRRQLRPPLLGYTQSLACKDRRACSLAVGRHWVRWQRRRRGDHDYWGERVRIIAMQQVYAIGRDYPWRLATASGAL